jgi:hypothetical protein
LDLSKVGAVGGGALWLELERDSRGTQVSIFPLFCFYGPALQRTINKKERCCRPLLLLLHLLGYSAVGVALKHNVAKKATTATVIAFFLLFCGAATLLE